MTISMLDYFLSSKYAGNGKVFEGLSIWQDEKFRALQGTYPVISLSFADIKENCYEKAIEKITQSITDLYNRNSDIRDNGLLTEGEKKVFDEICMHQASEVVMSTSIRRLLTGITRVSKESI